MNPTQRPRKLKSSLDQRAAALAPQLVDSFALATTFILLYLLIPGQEAVTTFLIQLPIYGIAYFFSAYLTRLYGSWRGANKTNLLLKLFLAGLLASMIYTYTCQLLIPDQAPGRTWLILALVIIYSLSSTLRLVLYGLVNQLRTQGINLKQVLLIGNQSSCQRIKQSMEDKKSQELGFVFSDLLTTHPEQAPPLAELQQRLTQQPVDEVWIVMPLAQGNQVRAIHDSLQSATVNVRYIPDLHDFHLLNHRMSELGPFWAVDLSLTPFEGGAHIIKNLEDKLLGLIFFTLSLPLMLIIAIAIKATSKGPVIFKQYRQGLDGKPFKIYKFRSLYVDDSKEFKPAQHNDPRITPIGKILRQTSMDELPQFLNVLQGRMSIVGPRPHVAEQNSYYNQVIHQYMQRHRVKPGITGWAQVHGLRGITQTDEMMRRRVEYDLYYINNWSLLLDIKIILLTVKKGLLNQNP